MGKPTHGSLFAGIGGFDLGFEKAGFRTVWQVEINPFCQQVLRWRFPQTAQCGDIRDCCVPREQRRKHHAGQHRQGPAERSQSLVPVCVVTFGSPCQDLSIAGKRAGLRGEQSGLYFEAIRIIREMREATSGAYPRFAVWENVPGAFSSRGGADFHTALQALADCGAVEIAWRVLDAQCFGVAQRRRRVFVVADFAAQHAHEILFESPSGKGNSPTGGETGREAARDAGSGPSEPAAVGYGELGQGYCAEGIRPLRANRPCNVICFQGDNKASGRADTAYVGVGDHGSGRSYVAGFSENQRGELRLTPYSRQLSSGGGKPGQGYPAVVHQAPDPVGMREASGLPRWLDGHPCHDSPRYRALGNAVAVPVAHWIAARMRGVLEK